MHCQSARGQSPSGLTWTTERAAGPDLRPRAEAPASEEGHPPQSTYQNSRLPGGTQVLSINHAVGTHGSGAVSRCYHLGSGENPTLPKSKFRHQPKASLASGPSKDSSLRPAVLTFLCTARKENGRRGTEKGTGQGHREPSPWSDAMRGTAAPSADQGLASRVENRHSNKNLYVCECSQQPKRGNSPTLCQLKTV